MSFIKRAETENLRNIFKEYASITKNAECFMTYEDFVINFMNLYPIENANKTSLSLIAGIVDSHKNGVVSFEEFQEFEGLLSQPDAMYAMAFQLFDQNANGYIQFDEFREVISSTKLYQHIPFDFDCAFTTLHFGKRRDRVINYIEFTQIIRDFHEEYAVQAFQRFDRKKQGCITASEFRQIMLLLKDYLLTPYTRDNLLDVTCGEDKSRAVTFPYFTAFVNLLSNMELVKKVFLTRTRGEETAEVSKGELLNEAQHYTQLTPLEIDILFQILKPRRDDGHVTYLDLCYVAPIDEKETSYHMQAQAKALQDAVETRAEGRGRTLLISIIEQVYRFTLGAIAGACGATAVYPIDLVKTRMQNQRSGSMVGELMYKNSWDCFKKVVRFEGVMGLYRGLAPQLVGVAPEKAIKLTVNDFIKDIFTDRQSGGIPAWSEILAGGCAGGSQVIFTNPLEIVKIRLQVAGEIASTKRISAFNVVRDLGFFGLYKGARACFLRDIPFSAIYFPSYSHLKMHFANADGYNSPLTLLLAATLAGAPAAYFTTPFDVIKTRLQVVARAGQTTYSGVFDAGQKILREEGFRALWKGGPARIFRSSPQFGVTLLTYEMLQRLFYVDFGGRKLSGTGHTPRPELQLPSNPHHIGGYKLATSTFQGLESKFGICLPKYEIPPAAAPDLT